MIKDSLTVINQLGLHARAAARIVETASSFASDVRLSVNAKSVDGKSIMGIMMLGATLDTVVNVTVEGDDETTAFIAIKALFDSRFGEDQ